MRRPRCVGVWCALAATVVAAPAVAAETWPQWRGPGGEGHATAARDLPVSWSETENIAWKTPLPGRGWSSPVIGDGLVWMTTAIEREASDAERAASLVGKRNVDQLAVAAAVTFHALAVDQASGRIRHDIELFTVVDPQPIHALNSFASPSPVLAGGRLFCHFGENGTACVDTASGEILWQNRVVRLEHENGAGSSPVLWRDLLIIHCDGSDTQSIIALDAATGEVRWRTARTGVMGDNPDLRKSYGTPLVLEHEGRDVLVSPASDWLYGYDPATGAELWKLSYGVLGFSVVPRPVAGRGLVFLSTGFTKCEMLAVRLEAAAPAIVWREGRGAPTMSSPLLVDDELYVVTDKGIATCLDARTGAVLWMERLGGNFSSSPLFADGRIYMANRDGDTFVLQPGREFERLATNRLDGRIFATPAAVDRAIYLRTDEALYRIEKPAAPTQAAR